jgi:hypothetical protein
MGKNYDLEELKKEKRRRLENRLYELESNKPIDEKKDTVDSFLNKKGVEEYLQVPSEIAKGALQGAANLAISPVNLARRAYSYASGDSPGEPYGINLFGKPENEIARNLGEVLSPIPFIGKSSAVAKLFERLSPNILGKVAGSAAQGAAIGGPLAGLLASNRQGSDIPYEALKGSEYGAAISPLLSSIFQSPSAAKSLLKNLAGGRSTPEQIQRKASYIPEGLKAPLGEIIDSPALTSIQKGLLKNIPFSGMGDVYNKLNDHARVRTNSIFDEISGGNVSENIPMETFMKAKENYLKVKDEVNGLYSDFRDKALNSGVEFDDSSLKKVIAEKSSDLNLSNFRPSVRPSINILKKDLDFYSKKKVSNFSDLENLRRDINDHYSSAMNDGDKLAMRSLAEIKSKLKETMLENAKKEPSVYDAFQKADSKYINEQIPFEVSGKVNSSGISQPSSFYKLVKSQNPNTSGFISDYIKPTVKNDDSRSIDDLLKMLPDQESKDQVATFHLKDSHDKDYGVSPTKLLNRYKNLGEKQRASLFPRHSNELDKLLKLKEIFPETFEPSYIPSTGYTMTKVGPIKAGLGALGGAMIGSSHPSVALGIPASIIAGKASTDFLTNKRIRDAYVNELKRKTADRQVGTIEKMLRDAMIRASVQNENQGDL